MRGRPTLGLSGGLDVDLVVATDWRTIHAVGSVLQHGFDLRDFPGGRRCLDGGKGGIDHRDDDDADEGDRDDDIDKRESGVGLFAPWARLSLTRYSLIAASA